jgi:hypothetical protein
MQVTAVATPGQPDWRWRIVNNAGEIIAESRRRYPSIAAAIADGTKRLHAMSGMDKSQRPALTRWRINPRRTA